MPNTNNGSLSLASSDELASEIVCDLDSVLHDAVNYLSEMEMYGLASAVARARGIILAQKEGSTPSTVHRDRR